VPGAPSNQLFPEVVDATTIIAKPGSPIFLPVGAEGQMDNDGSATVGTLYAVNTISDARTLFGVASSLSRIIEAVVKQGAYPVLVVPSKKGTAPNLTERQAAWDVLASDRRVRLRITDSLSSSDHAALGDNCESAELLQYKQVAICGLAAATSKSALLTAAGNIASSRAVLVAPGVYDADGVLRDGSYGAAVIAGEVAKNSDLSNDLDLLELSMLAGIEQTAAGLPIFRNKVVGGSKTNDFEDLLQGGVSPFMPNQLQSTGVQVSHLRTTYMTNTAFDALSTRLIVDQVFVDVRDYIFAAGFLHRGNTEVNRNALRAAVEALLAERADWVAPLKQPNGTLGYSVVAMPSSDLRQVTVSYSGKVVRGIQTIQVAGAVEIST
jgi:hypothetical protein